MKKLKTIKLGQFKFSFDNWKEFIPLYIGIFVARGYRFKTKRKDPCIIDCGSHIGISVLNFKKQYPKSEMVAFEPNPVAFKTLRKNVEQNSLEDVKLINAAVGDKKGKIDFYVNKKNLRSWGDSTIKGWFIKGDFEKIKVQSTRLSSHINSTVDLIKLNIEGLETVVLKEISGKLKHVREIFIHYHGEGTNKKNRLEDIFEILGKNSYEYSIRQLEWWGISKIIKRSQISKREPYFLFIHAKKKQK